MKKIITACCLLLASAVPAGAANLNCVDIKLLRITPAVDPAMKQAIFQLQSNCPEGGYNVEAGLYTGVGENPTIWSQHITANLSYFGPNQTAPAKQIFSYHPAGVVKFKVQVKHQGDIWGEKIISLPKPWEAKGPAIKKITPPISRKIIKP